MTLVYLPACRCNECGLKIRYGTDFYSLKNSVWNKAMTGRATRGDGVPGMLHIVCAERRLGRELRQRDFVECPINRGIFGFDIANFAP